MHRRKLGLTLVLILSVRAPVAMAADPPLAAPSGFQGAGLGMGDQKGRVWTETAFHTQRSYTIAAATLGAGYRVSESLEIEAMLPFAYISYDTFDVNGRGARTAEREHDFGIGNPYLGISRVHLQGTVRYKAGLGVTLPIATDEDPALVAVGFTPLTYGWQDVHLWTPDYLSIAAPLRVEAGDTLVFGVDAMPAVLIPTNPESSGHDVDTQFFLQVAPGAGIYATDNLLVGARLPIGWAVTENSPDRAQIALEPYARLDLGSGFVNARFTVNLDEPNGFAFDEGKVWGAHLGGGLVF